MNGKMMEDVVSDFFYISVMQVAGIHVLFDLLFPIRGQENFWVPP